MVTKEHILEAISREIEKYENKVLELKEDYQDYVDMVVHSAKKGKKDKISIAVKDVAKQVKKKYEKIAEEMILDKEDEIHDAKLGESV